MSHYVVGRNFVLGLLALKSEKRKVINSPNNLLMWRNYKSHNAMYMYTTLDGGEEKSYSSFVGRTDVLRSLRHILLNMKE